MSTLAKIICNLNNTEYPVETIEIMNRIKFNYAVRIIAKGC